jgi:periplasmic protein TonB
LSGGIPTSKDEANAAHLNSHFGYIRKRVKRALRSPRKASQTGMTGQTLVRFLICVEGTVKPLEVVESSGYPLLDRNALKTVRRAAPFPAPPIPAIMFCR